MAKNKKKTRRPMHRNRASPRTMALATVPAAGTSAVPRKPADPGD
jgi:hypothetical protein